MNTVSSPNFIERLFKVKARNSQVKTEVLAGSTTFLTMAYILFVNPSILAETGMDKTALIAVTCIVAAISSILMGIFPNVPIAMAPGMGMNAFFAYTIVIGQKVPWQTALGIVFWAGIVFLLLSVLGAREQLLKAIPSSLITAIAAGIGLFLIFIGMKNMGLVVDHPATLVTLGEFTPSVIIAILTLFLTIFLMAKGLQAGILIGIVFATVAGLVMGLIALPSAIISLNIDISPTAFQLDIMGALKLSLLGPIFAFMFIDMFDTLGTLVACAHQAKLVDKEGNIENVGKMLSVDAIATVISGLLGTSPTTSYVESASGIAAGGKTGLSSVITGLLFLLGLVFVPLIGIVPAFATAPALIIVGMLMLRQIQKIDFEQIEESFPALLTIVTMVFSFQISAGLAMGFLSWGIIKLLLGKWKAVSLTMWLIMLLSFMSLVL